MIHPTIFIPKLTGRVIYNPVMPTQPPGNLDAGVMMTAEKAADLILQDIAA